MSNNREINEGKAGPLGIRTQQMHIRMEEDDWPVISEGNKRYLEVGGNKFRIADGSVTDFISEPIVSIGAGLGRELIILDQSSATLKQNYQLLKNKLTALPQPTSIETVIEATMQAVRQMLNADSPNDLEKTLNNFCDNKAKDGKSLKYKDRPVITMGEFVRAKVGVCRHHALLMSYLLNQAQKDGLLPSGKIHHTRDNVKAGPHVWVTYLPANSQAIYLADSLWNRLVDLNTTSNTDNKVRGYGSEVLENCKKRFVTAKPNESFGEKHGLFAPSTKETDSITVICQILKINPLHQLDRKNIQQKLLTETVGFNNIRLYYTEIKLACKIPEGTNVEKWLTEKLGEKEFVRLKLKFDGLYNMLGFMKNAHVISGTQYQEALENIKNEIVSTLKQECQVLAPKK